MVMFLDYVLKYHLHDCVNIISEPDILGYYNVKIDFLKLLETYPDVGDNLLCKSIKYVPACDQDLVKAQQKILENDDIYSTELQNLPCKILKRNIHARFYGLPVCPELHRTIFPKNVDLECFLQVTGTVVRVTQAKMLEYNRKYVCLKCKYENYVEAEFEHRYVLKPPTKCGNDVIKCKCTTFNAVNLISREHCKDYQEIKIQEQVNKLSIGTIPGSMWVILDNDLVDCCKPGDDVQICGTVRRRWRPTVLNRRSEVELVLQANYVEVCNSQRSEVVSTAPDVKDCFDEYWEKFDSCPMKGRDSILSTVCPQVFGLHLVKLALLLTVITGSNHAVETENDKKTSSEDRDKNNVRGQCHLLLVGDPGTGKSQLLRTGVELTPRSVFTSGAGSTRAGLTCSALREDGEWQLEAGALVLSDGGVCCIDEIGQLREHDRTSIHEAMEQQTISIAKAGIVCKLNTRCAVVAACNPKGHYDTDQPLSANVSLGTPLLSRFDLIFILLDTKHKEWDREVSSYILFNGTKKAVAKQWNIEKLQMYIALVGPKTTEMTKSANIILQTYYMMQRKSEHRDPSRTTVRMLDSLVRLSQAHCRLMYRTQILPMDAIVAVSLIDLSMQDCTLKDTADALHSTFPRYPDFDYLVTANKLLTNLNLYDIWKNELIYYGKLLNVDHKTLEHEIETGNIHSFKKFDDLSDDNIPLSCSLVTSSYFNNRKHVNEIDHNDDDKELNINGCLVKKSPNKHSYFNKINKNHARIKINNSKQGKRKRKEVVEETSSILEKIKKIDKNVKKAETSDGTPKTDLLKGIPSVNDVFYELNLNFDIEDVEIKEEGPSAEELIKGGEEASINNESINNENKSTKDKLKQFQFLEKKDLSKFKENINNMSVADAELKTENVTVTTLSVGKSSSQLSIFDNSECDIDFDL